MTRAGDGAATAPPAVEAAVWHDVECGGYTADLPLWRELTAQASGAVLELGAGTGRVALDLAARGGDVTALDTDPELVGELARRAREHDLRVRAVAADARAFELGRRFCLVIAPMQLVQLLGGADGRQAMLAAVRRHVEPGSILAIALADPLEGLPADEGLPPLPDVREVGGWVYSSRPVSMRQEDDAIVIERVREAVSPSGDLRESAVSLRLDRAEPGELETVAAKTGFRTLPRRSVPATESYVGSVVVALEAR